MFIILCLNVFNLIYYFVNKTAIAFLSVMEVGFPPLLLFLRLLFFLLKGLFVSFILGQIKGLMMLNRLLSPLMEICDLTIDLTLGASPWPCGLRYPCNDNVPNSIPAVNPHCMLSTLLSSLCPVCLHYLQSNKGKKTNK